MFVEPPPPQFIGLMWLMMKSTIFWPTSPANDRIAELADAPSPATHETNFVVQSASTPGRFWAWSPIQESNPAIADASAPGRPAAKSTNFAVHFKSSPGSFGAESAIHLRRSAMNPAIFSAIFSHSSAPHTTNLPVHSASFSTRSGPRSTIHLRKSAMNPASASPILTNRPAAHPMNSAVHSSSFSAAFGATSTIHASSFVAISPSFGRNLFGSQSVRNETNPFQMASNVSLMPRQTSPHWPVNTSFSQPPKPLILSQIATTAGTNVSMKKSATFLIAGHTVSVMNDASASTAARNQSTFW